MQSNWTLRPARAPFGFSRTQLLTLGLAAGLLALSLAGFVARQQTTATTSRPHAVASGQTAANYRFTEANTQFPTSGAATTSTAYLHMLEINQLPNAAPAIANNAHMLEINQLPEATAPSAASQPARARFQEINQLPGDATPAATRNGLIGNRE
jgi:hypothetical protein